MRMRKSWGLHNHNILWFSFKRSEHGVLGPRCKKEELLYTAFTKIEGHVFEPFICMYIVP